MARNSDLKDFILSMYSARAPGYDVDNDGWHIQLGLEFIDWVRPQKGDVVLDLACGTGLVTIPAAEAVGETGIVIGVDLTVEMLQEAQRKPVKTGSAQIKWIQHDISDLKEVPEVQDIVEKRGGFDVVSCCSAFVFVPDRTWTVKYWSSLLKPGGKIIIDIPTEDKTLQLLFHGEIRDAVGTPLPIRRDWITGIRSLEEIYEDAGLEVERSWRTRSYLPEHWYEEHERDSVFDEQMKVYGYFERKGKVEEAREVFNLLWEENLRDNGKFWDGHTLYVAVGRKRGEN